jgi:regulator of sirC expression with transglutaminase-like and TPR domain
LKAVEPTTLPESELRALISLLDDEDDFTRQAAEAKVCELGVRAEPLLREAATLGTESLREAASGLLRSIAFPEFLDVLNEFAARANHQIDLEEGAFLLARMEYPTLDETPYRRRLDRWGKRVAARLSGDESPTVQVTELNEVLFEEVGFKACHDEYYDPDNSFLNRVIDRRQGIPLTMSVAYMLVARRAGIPLLGVGMPGHFLVKHANSRRDLFIDPFNGGQLLTYHDCRQFLMKSGYGFWKGYLSPVSSRAILVRMMRNLQLVYSERHERDRVERVSRALKILAAGDVRRGS